MTLRGGARLDIDQRHTNLSRSNGVTLSLWSLLQKKNAFCNGIFFFEEWKVTQIKRGCNLTATPSPC